MLEQTRLEQHIIAAMGVDQFAYIKQVSGYGMTGFAVFAADGTPLATFDNHEEAILSVKRHNLTPLSLH